MILRSAILGAIGFGAAFAIVGLYFLGAIPASLVVGLGAGVSLSILFGRASPRFALSVASTWVVGAYALLPGGPAAGILVAHMDERTASLLLRLALWGALGGGIAGLAAPRWRAKVDILLAGALGLPVGLLVGSALLPYFITSTPMAALSPLEEGLYGGLALAGAIGGALAGAVFGAAIGYHRDLENKKGTL